MAIMTVHEVLGGAYKGRRAKLDSLLTHASIDGGHTAICGGVAAGNLCDVELPTAPTCGRCARKFI